MAKSKGMKCEPIPSIMFNCKGGLVAAAINQHLSEEKKRKGISATEQRSLDRVIEEISRASTQLQSTKDQSSAIVVSFLLGPRKKGAKT